PRDGPGDARCVDLRARTDGVERDRVGVRQAAFDGGDMRALPIVPARTVELSIDGKPVRVNEGATILQACRAAGIDTPTLCYADNLTPVNVCRVCVVEVENARVLVPACSRKVEDGMVVLTDSERVRTSRRLVLELLGSACDLSTAPEALEYVDRYDAEPERFGPDSLTVAQ